MGCGCKDDEPIKPVIRENVVMTDSDAEAKIRLLEAELQMWKDSFNDLSNEYMSIVGDEEGIMPPTADNSEEPNGWLPPDREVDARMELRIKFLTVRDKIDICDVFEAIQINVNDEIEGISVMEINTGVTALEGEVFEDPED